MEVSARPGGPDGTGEVIGVKQLVEKLSEIVEEPQRDVKGPFVFAVDHCFAIQGQV